MAAVINVLYAWLTASISAITGYFDACSDEVWVLPYAFPIIMIITAFASLFGMGGAPLCSIARRKGDDRGRRIMEIPLPCCSSPAFCFHDAYAIFRG